MALVEKEKSNVVWMAGGLGNQLFQYAFGRHIERISGFRTLYDISWFLNGNKNATPRKLEIEQIVGDISSHYVNFSVSRKYKTFGYYFNKIIKANLFNVKFVNEVSFSRGNFCFPSYFQGYWQDVMRIQEEVLSVRHRNLKNTRITHLPYICMHIRRGDYTNATNKSLFCELNEEYYQKAVDFYYARDSKEVDIYIFTDDMKWAENIISHLDHVGKVQYCEFNDAPSILFEMISCRSVIAANSTLSLWAGMLSNRNEPLVAPKKWFVNKEMDLPKQWVRL